IDTWNVTVIPDAPFEVTSFSPADGGVINSEERITVTFSEPVFKNNGKVRFYRTSDVKLLSDIDINESEIVVDGATVSIPLPVDLPESTDFFVHFSRDALRSSDNDNLSGLFTTTTWNLTKQAGVPLSITSLSPVDGANVTQGSLLKVVFNKEVLKKNGKIRIYKSSDQTLLYQLDIQSSKVSVEEEELSFKLPNDLPIGEEFFVHMSPKSLEDTEGNNIAGFFDVNTWNLTPTIDVLPTIVSLSPIGGANTEEQTTFTATFSEAMFKNNGKLRIYKKSDLSLMSVTDISSSSITVSGSTLSFDLPAGLPAGEELLIHLSKAALVDAGGNDINGLFTVDTWNFTINAVPPSTVNEAINSAELEKVKEVTYDFNIYPNPVKDVLTLDLSGVGDSPSVRIVDLTGAEKYSKARVDQTTLRVDVKDYPSGLYL
ncbi:Ig-like domain-containing protein, partial [Roseivirga sp.]|uniref:Ig-like domain-containing protein n=1 Tax=Roseivirga sp. TaxID=1964215 RepID=UPI003B8B275B